jgi:hypothetical protein
MTVDSVTFYLIQLQACRAKLVSERGNLNNVIAKLDEGIHLITLLSYSEEQPPQNYLPQHPIIITELFSLLHHWLERDPDPNTTIEFRLG